MISMIRDAEAEELLERAIALNPLVTMYGLGTSEGLRWTHRRNEKFDHSQRELKENGLPAIAACAGWLEGVEPIQTINRRSTSYVYKHSVERWFAAHGSPIYIPNGAFIAAAIGLGYKWRSVAPNQPNLYFNFSQRDLNRLSYEELSAA